MEARAPFVLPHRPDPAPGDAVRVPRELMSGPGRSWEAEPRWRWVEIRIGGRWQPGQVERWHLSQGSTRWMALIGWGQDARTRGWYFYDPETVRRTPGPSGSADRARSLSL